MALTIPKGTAAYRNYRTIGWILFIAVVVLAAMAFFDVGRISIGQNNYNLSLIRINKAISFMVAILGLQIIVGYTGQLALGQSLFVGLGAYITAYLVQDQGWPYMATLVVVIPFCFVIGVLLGLPALRIKGLYLALVTITLAAVFPAIVRLPELFDITNGSNGKSVDADLIAPDWLALNGLAGFLQGIPFFGQYFGDGELSTREADRVWKYLLFVLLAAICFWLVSNLFHSRMGRAMRAVRDNEASAAVSGVDLARTKTLAFGIGSALGGVGGAIYVMELVIASPDDFALILAINLLVGLVVGGVANPWGAVLGGLVIGLVPDWASSTTEIAGVPDRWLQGPTGSLFLGALLILLTFVLPGGIAQGLSKLKQRVFNVVPTPPPLLATEITTSGHEIDLTEDVIELDDEIAEPVTTADA